MKYIFENQTQKIEYEPESSSLKATVFGVQDGGVWSWSGAPRIILQDGTSLSFNGASCQSSIYRTGVAEGIRAKYSDFKMQNSREYPFVVTTLVYNDLTTGDLKTELLVEGDEKGEIKHVAYPPKMEFKEKRKEAYSVLPLFQGSILPAGEGPIQFHDGRGKICESEGWLSMFGQVRRACGYIGIFETPYDAGYEMYGDEIQPFFRPSLGKMSYKRVFRYGFFAKGDFNTIAKKYRAYLSEKGELVTLREKIQRNPKIAELIGTPIVHEETISHRALSCRRYNKEKPEENHRCIHTFREVAERLTVLQKKGVEKAYLHLDGWGVSGYDNQHPDFFPINEEAGGAQEFIRLQQVCNELGYMFGVHDQYRDYYYDAKTFSFDNAVLNVDGTHPYCDFWDGGAHTHLCASLAPDYVRRNYNTFESIGVKIDGAYLDVFGFGPADECDHPEHRMTRKECAEKRRECFDLLSDRGIIPSTEAVNESIVNSIALCHHAPFAYNGEYIGIPIPLFNLVRHDCVIIPWNGLSGRGGDCIPPEDSGFLWALLCGNTIYYSPDNSEKEIERGKIALELAERVAFCELIAHELLNGNPRVRRSVFSDGTVVTVDFDQETYRIDYPKE